MLGIWMSENKTTNWVLGLNFVQLAKNTRQHSGVGNPPYTLQYGQTVRYGIKSLPIDEAIIRKIETEDELVQVMSNIKFVTEGSRAEPMECDMTNSPPDISDPVIDDPAIVAPVIVAPVIDAPVLDASGPFMIASGHCVQCRNVMNRDYLCIGCDSSIHWFCAAGNSDENESKGHGRHYWCLKCYNEEPSPTVTQEPSPTGTLDDAEDDASAMDVDVSDLLCSPEHLNGSEEAECNKENVGPTKYDTPVRGNLRTLASISQQQQAKRMQKRVREDTIQDVPVGGICLVPIDRVDRSKIDPKRLPCVVVEITPRIQYRLACKAGVLDRVLCRQDFCYEPNKTAVFYGLQDALQNWKVMRKVSIRSGSGAIAPLGGQGHLHCGCSGKCDTKRCGCLKAGQKCNSRCHPTNSKCCNKCD
jgi:hypothetical protein